MAVDVQRLEDAAYSLQEWLWLLPIGREVTYRCEGIISDEGRVDMFTGLLVTAPDIIRLIENNEAELARNNLKGAIEVRLAAIPPQDPPSGWTLPADGPSFRGTSGFSVAAHFISSLCSFLFGHDPRHLQCETWETADEYLFGERGKWNERGDRIGGEYNRLCHDLTRLQWHDREQTGILTAQIWWEFYQAGGGLPGTGPFFSMRDIRDDLDVNDNRTVTQYFDRANVEPPQRGEASWRIDGETYCRLLRTIEAHGVNEAIRTSAQKALRIRCPDSDAIM